MIPNCKQAKYSTKEQKIGTWIDGKKIYRKTFKFQLNGTYAENNKKYTWYTTGIKIEDIINIYGYTSLRDGSKYPIGNNVSDFSISIDSTSNIVVGLRSDLQVRTMVLYCIRIHKNIRLFLQSLSKNKMIPIIEIASKLPTSKSSINAYIVEMCGKDDKAIAKRFISESLGTIEHIVPDSKGGANEAYNFIFVTKSRNEERSNTPMKYFMQKYPDIPKYCTQYMNDIMKAGQNFQLRGHEWYPYVIKETMREEMGVNVNISSYRVSPQKAFRSFPQRLKEKYPKFEKYFTNPQ